MRFKFKSRLSNSEGKSWTALQKYRNRPEVFRLVNCIGFIPRIVSGSGSWELRWLEPFYLFQAQRQTDGKWINIGFESSFMNARDRLREKLEKGARKFEIVTNGKYLTAVPGPKPGPDDIHIIDPSKEPLLPGVSVNPADKMFFNLGAMLYSMNHQEDSELSCQNDSSLKKSVDRPGVVPLDPPINFSGTFGVFSHFPGLMTENDRDMICKIDDLNTSISGPDFASIDGDREFISGVPEISLVAENLSESNECYCDRTVCPECSACLKINIP